jgi:hypothetical protein
MKTGLKSIAGPRLKSTVNSLSLLVLNEKYREILSYCPVLAHILT